jgi:hypothetical protein
MSKRVKTKSKRKQAARIPVPPVFMRCAEWNPLAFGLSLGIVYAAGIFILGLAAANGRGTEIVSLMADFYVGFGPSFNGAILGAISAFVEGFIGGAVVAWIYNQLI